MEKVLLMEAGNNIMANKQKIILVQVGQSLAVQEMYIRYECILRLFGNSKKKHTIFRLILLF